MLDTTSDAQALDREHRWNLDVPDGDVTIIGDPNSLRQVMVNLLANSVEHTPPGTRTTITLSQNDHEVTIVVSDDGPGIPADFLPHIFERFARADSAREHTNGESGLGLAIVEAIVRAHDGGVTVTSEPGATAFTVRLPKRPDR